MKRVTLFLAVAAVLALLLQGVAVAGPPSMANGSLETPYGSTWQFNARGGLDSASGVVISRFAFSADGPSYTTSWKVMSFYKSEVIPGRAALLAELVTTTIPATYGYLPGHQTIGVVYDGDVDGAPYGTFDGASFATSSQFSQETIDSYFYGTGVPGASTGYRIRTMVK